MSKGWHFVGAALRNGDPVPADGVTLRYDGPLVMCESGLHYSEQVLDALQYAPGETCCRVEVGGEIVHDTDKAICRERTILWRVDSTAALRAFARRCALDVADLWDAPESVVRYLRSGDESIRAAARATASAAAKAAARAAASAAAWDAARAAAWDAARDAARAAAWDAARDGQNTTLETMIREARVGRSEWVARAAARAAAWAAARDAARDGQNTTLETMIREARVGRSEWAARAAARDAARDGQNTTLETMIREARVGRSEWVYE